MEPLPLHKAVERNDAPSLRTLLDAGIDPNERDERGFTALHYAVISRRLAMVPILLQHGADTKAAVAGHGDALDMAARRDDIEMLKLLSETT